MCVSVDGGTARCAVGGLPSNTKARGDAGAQNNWKVTLAGYGTSKPTIDVTFTWPTANPMIKLTHGRLQGVGPKVIEGLNGFTATFKPRGAGSLNVQASWTGVTADVDLSLADVTTPLRQARRQAVQGRDVRQSTVCVQRGLDQDLSAQAARPLARQRAPGPDRPVLLPVAASG